MQEEHNGDKTLRFSPLMLLFALLILFIYFLFNKLHCGTGMGSSKSFDIFFLSLMNFGLETRKKSDFGQLRNDLHFNACTTLFFHILSQFEVQTGFLNFFF